ncbi:hypothetical protein B6U91_01585 [Candidatus Pacearchaeota archaeon ex4484_71]|nr:MAG: hypothetical protein B6U91_01585 [Candidatus Pacearchaeota archaeon ex4484_71]
MKHNLKITIILLSMFLVTQFIGLFVIHFYSGAPIPFGLGSADSNIDSGSAFISILVAFTIAILLMMVLIRFKTKFVMRTWFFVVVMIALGVSFNAILSSITPGFKYMPFVALLFALPLALSKIYTPNMISHNLSELFIYPGIAVIFIPMLNVLYLMIFLVLISLYDAWAVWKSGIMQKMAKYQMEKVKVFGGFLLPYLSKRQRKQVKVLKKKNPQLLKKKKFKVTLAILGGGDIVFPIISAGVMFKFFGVWAAVITILGAALGLGFLLFYGKKKAYPAMPFISTGIFLAIGLIYLIF